MENELIKNKVKALRIIIIVIRRYFIYITILFGLYNFYLEITYILYHIGVKTAFLSIDAQILTGDS